MASTSNPSGAVNTSSCHSIHGPVATGAPVIGKSNHPISGAADRVTAPPRAWERTWAPKQIASSGTWRAMVWRTSAASASTSADVSGRYTFHSDPSVRTSSAPSSPGQPSGSSRMHSTKA